MGIDEFNKNLEDRLHQAELRAGEVASGARKVLVWICCLILPISIGAYLGEVLPAWGGPVYGFVATWLALVFFGDSRYRWIIALVTFAVTCFSWYLGLLVEIN